MPSAFAHAAVGASLASLAPRAGRAFPLALVLAVLAAAPDLDVLAFAFGIPYGHPLGHRGLSHSLFFAIAVGAFSFPLWRRWLPRDAMWASLLTCAALASHGVLDAFTDAGLGIGLLIPFDDTRYFFPWRPILTSPLSARAFFSPSGVAILLNEALWVGVPVVILLAGVRAFQRLLSSRGAP